MVSPPISQEPTLGQLIPYAHSTPGAPAGQAHQEASGSSLREQDHEMLRNWETYGSFVDSDLERGPGAVDPETISRFDAAFAKLPRYDGIMYSNMQFGNSWGFGNRSKGVTFTE